MPDDVQHSEPLGDDAPPERILLDAFRDLLSLPCEHSTNEAVQESIARTALRRLGYRLMRA